MKELPQDTRSAIIHLGHLLKRDGLDIECGVDFFKGEAEFYLGEYSETIDLSTHNPIQAVLNNVFEEVCTDCLKLDYYFQDPFFVSLIKGYVEGLIAKYGNEVPVTETIAKVCLEHQLTKHSVCFRTKDGILNHVLSANDDAFGTNQSWFIKTVNYG